MCETTDHTSGTDAESSRPRITPGNCVLRFIGVQYNRLK